MKVLHLISSGGMYGAEAVILNLSTEFEASQLGTAVVGAFAHVGHPAPALHEAAVHRGVSSELVLCRGQADLSVLKVVRERAKRIGADVIHAHGYKADIYAWLAWKGRRRPALVSTCHNWIDTDRVVKAYGVADRWVLRSFDQVVAVSEQVRDRLVKAGVPSQRVRLIRNGISVAPFSSANFGRTQGRGEATLRVGLVGRLGPEKGIDLFIRAAKQISATMPHVQFHVAGEGPIRATLEALVASLALEDRVQLLGSQSDMPAFYASLDLLVSSSHYEGLPMALLEGMASGLPVVATRVGQVPEVVLDGQTGVLVAPGDPDALAQAMGRLLANSQQRAAYGDAGRQRVIEHFSAERMAAEYLDVYRQALSGRGSPSERRAKTNG